jgi:hypothetical protein
MDLKASGTKWKI